MQEYKDDFEEWWVDFEPKLRAYESENDIATKNQMGEDLTQELEEQKLQMNNALDHYVAEIISDYELSQLEADIVVDDGIGLGDQDIVVDNGTDVDDIVVDDSDTQSELTDPDVPVEDDGNTHSSPPVSHPGAAADDHEDVPSGGHGVEPNPQHPRSVADRRQAVIAHRQSRTRTRARDAANGSANRAVPV